MEPIAERLLHRIDAVLAGCEAPERNWGDPGMLSTPNSLAIENLSQRTEALEAGLKEVAFALRELAQELSDLNPLKSGFFR